MRGCVRASDVRGLTALVVVAAAALAPACSPRVLQVVDPTPKDTLPVDLVGWWQLDEGAGSLVARDISGQGNDATLFGVDGTDPLVWPPGHEGRSVETAGA